MNNRPRSWVLALTLGIVFGCAGEDAGTGMPPVTPSASPSARKPDVTPGGPAGKAPTVETKGESKAPSDSKVETRNGENPLLEGPKADESKGNAPAVQLTAAEIAEIKALPVDEQGTALKQAVCPVSGEHLGSMGAPVKVDAEGRSFYLCCKNCKEEVASDPKGVIAKLDKK
jgi:YHS domain-containing protein